MAAGLALIPLGAGRGWAWVRWYRLRLTHVALMGFVALEGLVGVTCPLTELEHWLRATEAPRQFWAYWLSRWLYWDLPAWFFAGLYAACAGWTFWLWRYVPPVRSARRY